MAITDIDFQEGEGQDFIIEVPTGAVNAAADELIESASDSLMLYEIPTPTGGGGGDIFIIND